MGDDVHVRTQAATNLLHPAPAPAHGRAARGEREPFARFLSGNHLFFLTLAMAAAQVAHRLGGARCPARSVVTTMARNGTPFGIRLAGSNTLVLAPRRRSGRRSTTPATARTTRTPDIGDSAVLELVGLGGAAAAGSPAVGQLVGGPGRRRRADRRARAGLRGPVHPLHPADPRRPGTPLAVDVRKVVESGITPKVTTGILHASDGSGQVGAGVADGTARLLPRRAARARRAADGRLTGAPR